MYPLIAKWTILPGNEEKALAALKDLAAQVLDCETGTLVYAIFTPDFSKTSLPTRPAGEVTFIEIYESNDAFLAHIKGDTYNNFLKNYGQLFLNDFNGKPFVTFEAMEKQAGFFRSAVSEAVNECS
jgi:quinol monooxygenase YgiN